MAPSASFKRHESQAISNPIASPRDVPHEKTLVDLFDQYVALYPGAVALEDQTAGQLLRRQVTYHELQVASNCFSQKLRKHGVKAGDVVPVLGKRSVDMVVAVLAILQLRACYVPIDLDSWGSDRINTTLNLIQCTIIISELPMAARDNQEVVLLNSWSAQGKLDMDSGLNVEAIKSQLQERQIFSSPQGDLAYIIFTSGTTGVPKGVMVSQSSMTAYVQAGADLPFNLAASVDSRILLICSMAFDACAGIMFSALCNGATLVLADPSTMVAALKTCTIVPLTPSILATMDPEEESAVETIFLGGETPSSSLINAWSTRNRKIYNAYGPTETTCTTLMAELKPGSPVLVGKNIHYSRIVLINEDGEETDEGELYISGLGVAVGYYQNEALTDAAFVMREGERYFKTGDYARQTPDGIMLLGRRDSFVKNRGFLINLEGDVEPALLSYDEVHAAVAIHYGGRLYGIVSPRIVSQGLREYLKQNFSNFIIPDVIISRDTFPQTANDKVDRKALLKIIVDSKAVAEHVDWSEELSPVKVVLRVFSQIFDIAVVHIDESSSFRDLGGHSLSAVMAVSTLRKLGYFISVPEILQLDTVSTISSALRQAEAAMPDPLQIEEKTRKLTKLLGAEEFSKLDLEDIAPMTDMQARMVRTSIDLHGQNFIRAGMTFEHVTSNTVEVLRHSWKTVMQRHSIFRTTYSLSIDEGVQLVHKKPAFGWDEIDVTDENWPSACNMAERFEPENFPVFEEHSLGSLNSFKLVTSPGIRSRLIWTIHHSLIDGWSISRIISEVQRVSDSQNLLTVSQFSEAAKWIKLSEEEGQENAKQFWSRTLKDVSPDSRMQVAQPPGIVTLAQSEQHLKLKVRLSDLNDFARRSHVTSASVIYSAWAILLSRYAGTSQVVFGAVIAGRNLPVPGIEEVAGPLMNSLPFVVHLDRAGSALELLQHVFTSLCETIEFQWSSNAMIKEAVGTKGTDFFESMLALQYDFPKFSSNWKVLKEPNDIRYSEATEAPLTVIMDQIEEHLDIRVLYKTSRFGDAFIQRLMGHFANVLENLFHSSNTVQVDDIAGLMLESKESSSLLNNSEHLDLPYTGHVSVKAALETSALQFKDYVAIECLGRRITYAEMDLLTNRLANNLAAHVSYKDRVCIICDGSIEWILAIVAVIKCGASYCSIDIRLPVERQRLILAESGSTVVLYTSSASMQGSVAFPNTKQMSIDLLLEDPAQNLDRIETQVLGNDLVCVVFTSGSTGTPKGVQLQNAGILSLLAYAPGRLHSTPGQRNAQLLSVGFDGCVKEVFAALCHGATLVLKDPEDPLAHLSIVDATMITPSLLKTLDPNSYTNLKVINLVGEAVPQGLVDKWGHGRILQNGYGPAECTLVCLYADLIPFKTVTIGRPVPRLACYILDEKMRPCPVGITGELYLSGIQVTPGYLSPPKGQLNRFLQNPFREGWRMYRTGDKVRWSESGEVEYIGREDDQIKHRGYRIDLGDIEGSIMEVMPSIANAAVVVIDGRLVAFVSPSSIDILALSHSLQTKLPHYSQVTRIIVLEKLPLSPNQKVDRKALAALNIPHQAEFTPLASNTEKTVSEIWKEVLKKNDAAPIGAHNHFFDLGGHSLLQIRVAQQITQQLGISKPLRLVIRHHVLRDLCTALDEALEREIFISTEPFAAFAGVTDAQNMPLSYLEQDFYFNYLLAENKTAFNLPFVARIQGQLCLRALSKAFEEVILSSDILRARYLIIDGKMIRQTSSQVSRPQFEIADSDLPGTVQRQLDLPFDLEHDDPIRVLFIMERPGSMVIVLTMSHIIGDRTTLNNILSDWSNRYQKYVEPQTPPPEGFQNHRRAGLSYADWAVWTADQKPEISTIDFWQTYLEDFKNSPAFLVNGVIGSYKGTSRIFTLRESLSQRLLNVCKDSSVTQHHLALTAIGIVMHALTLNDDVVVGAPYGNRLEPGTEDVLGLFLDRLPIRLKFDEINRPIMHLLKETRSSSQDAMAHFVPFQQLCKTLGLESISGGPLFEVMVTYHMEDEASQNQISLGECTVQPLPAHASGAKFPLMFEFSEVESRIVIDMEYDTVLISEELMDSIEAAISVTLELMATRCDGSAILTCLSGIGLPKLRAQGSHLEHPPSTCNCGGGICKVLEVSGAVADFLNVDSKDINCKRSIFDMGVSSGDCPAIQHLLGLKGIQISLRELLLLHTPDRIAHRI